ncbi:MAG: hypothetical protein AAFP90_23000, partial [Planctomycetota bacterium]
MVDAEFSEEGAKIQIGSETYTFDATQRRSISFNGNPEIMETVQVTGSANKDSVNVRLGSANVVGTWYQWRAFNIGQFSFNGGGGEDVARFYDDSDAAPGEFAASPFQASFASGDYVGSVSQVHRIYAYATGSGDSANLTGAGGRRDNFQASPQHARISDGDYYIFARGFDSVVGTATDDLDRAYLYDSPADDRLTSEARLVILQENVSEDLTSSYALTAAGFAYSRITASAGGNDVAVLQGTPQDDRFTVRPDESTINRPEDRTIVRFFESIDAFAGGGEDDRAEFFDSQHNDTYFASPDVSRLQNTLHTASAHGFDRTYARSNTGGYDTAIFQGTQGDDIYDARPDRSVLRGSGYYLFAAGFNETTALAGEGFDRAYLYDSAFNDLLTLNVDTSRLTGERF